MEKFVRVRVIQGNALDLNLFQFDYDLTFGAFFLNADRAIYGRYGTRSDQKEAERDISLEGFAKAMEAALALHEIYPANQAALAGKTGPRPAYATPEKFPALAGNYSPTLNNKGTEIVKSCIHCHQIREAERKVPRSAGRPLPDDLLYPWPMPDVVGLIMDPKEMAKVTRVVPGSQAARDGFQNGDEILTLAGQPLISTADLQWVLHSAKDPVRLPAEVRRGGRTVNLQLNLAAGWRKASDIAWRVTSWDLRRSAFGGMKMDVMNDSQLRQRGLPANSLGLEIKHVGQYGEHARAKQAGFRKDDILIAVEGKTAPMNESQLLAYLIAKPPGAKIPVTVLRGNQRLQMQIPTQK